MLLVRDNTAGGEPRGEPEENQLSDRGRGKTGRSLMGPQRMETRAKELKKPPIRIRHPVSLIGEKNRPGAIRQRPKHARHRRGLRI